MLLCPTNCTWWRLECLPLGQVLQPLTLCLLVPSSLVEWDCSCLCLVFRHPLLTVHTKCIQLSTASLPYFSISSVIPPISVAFPILQIPNFSYRLLYHYLILFIHLLLPSLILIHGTISFLHIHQCFKVFLSAVFNTSLSHFSLCRKHALSLYRGKGY